ncbi:hypothetical protein LSAT2_018588, partial [Lamellibrachia satsuma]
MVSGADSVYGIVADPCDCQNYYQCEYNTTTQLYIAYQRSCNPWRLNRVKAPLVFGGCVCGGDCYFDGFMDSICFLKGALGQAEVDYLFDNPSECLP